jgi:hypothetical protein
MAGSIPGVDDAMWRKTSLQPSATTESETETAIDSGDMAGFS